MLFPQPTGVLYILCCKNLVGNLCSIEMNASVWLSIFSLDSDAEAFIISSLQWSAEFSTLFHYEELYKKLFPVF